MFRGLQVPERLLILTSSCGSSWIPSNNVQGEAQYRFTMKAKTSYRRESDGKYLGYLNEIPDHWTQAEDLDDLKKHLRDLVIASQKAGCQLLRTVSAMTSTTARNQPVPNRFPATGKSPRSSPRNYLRI
jgi:hypothetical protein